MKKEKSFLEKHIFHPKKLFQKLYHWTIHWAKTKEAKKGLFLVSFSESSFFPIPPDVLLIPMVAAKRNQWWNLALLTTVASILGAMLGYLIGFGFYEAIAKPIINFYNLQEEVALVGTKYAENAFLTIFTAAFTPIPFKAFTIAGGIFKIPLGEFLLGAILGRASRFFAIAYIIKKFGPQAKDFVKKYFNLLSIILVILIIAILLLLKYLN